MPVLTELQGTTITGSVDSPVLTLPPTLVLNDLGPGQTIDSYNVQDDTAGPNEVVNGDFLAPVVGGSPVPGTYLGSATISTASVSVGVLDTGLSVQLNPLEGHLMQGADGQAYFISDTPLNASNLGVSITGEVLGIPIATVNGDLDGVFAQLPEPLRALFTDSADFIQQVLNTVVISVDVDTDGRLILDDEIIDIVCFAHGTLIETPDGAVPVQDLRVGDLVMTRDHGPQPLRWTGSQHLSAAMLRRHPRLVPVRIRAGALGAGSPAQDLVVSPQHRVLVRSRIAQRMFGTTEVLVAAKQLLVLDGFDLATDLTEVTYHHVMFDQHEVVTSNGAETESLYAGAQALRMVGPAARDELMALFPQLALPDHLPSPARELPPNRMVRQMAERHRRNARALVG
ncbi:MAG: Hint domain-containing protein [Paracoccus hibiscisoli]|uniref:Hint domain-containing protein n=1 Tax=Paracoccus hibiscisoli TaxID=2023261 RepID=UPI003918AB29